MLYLVSAVPLWLLLSTARLLGRDRVADPATALEYWTTAPYIWAIIAYASVLLVTALLRTQNLTMVFARSAAATFAYLTTAGVIQLGSGLSDPVGFNYLFLFYLMGFVDGIVLFGLTIPLAAHLVARRLADVPTHRVRQDPETRSEHRPAE